VVRRRTPTVVNWIRAEYLLHRIVVWMFAIHMMLGSWTKNNNAHKRSQRMLCTRFVTIGILRYSKKFPDTYILAIITYHATPHEIHDIELYERKHVSLNSTRNKARIISLINEISLLEIRRLLSAQESH